MVRYNLASILLTFALAACTTPQKDWFIGSAMMANDGAITLDLASREQNGPSLTVISLIPLGIRNIRKFWRTSAASLQAKPSKFAHGRTVEGNSVVGLLGLLAFAAIQGGVVFATAYAATRIMHVNTRSAKAAAMAISYVGWVAITIGGYAVMGGDGGLMDGFGLVLVLCSTALVSSVAYLIAWTSRA